MSIGYVCLSVCLFVPTHISKTAVEISRNFLYLLPVTVARSFSDDNAMVCTSGFADDVTFLYNGGNRLGLKTTRIFRPVHQMVAPVGRQTTLFGRHRRMAAPVTKSAVSDCSLFQN